jgi:7,8-dihydro-6-hydroxymethylpterin-pyrophosphokinase
MNAATLELLVAKGLSPADLIEVARAMEQRADNSAAERQRKCRARKKANGHTVTVTRDGSPNDIDILTPSLALVSSNELTVPEPELKPEDVVEVWNENAPGWGLKPIRKLTPHRRRKLATRIRENSIDEFTEAITAIGRSPFLRGESQRGWRANFDWMLEPSNFAKLIEGTYDR